MEKILFGKLLGEIYRIQNRNGYSPVSEARIYGLLNGFEGVINEEIDDIGIVTEEEVIKVMDILDTYHLDLDELENLSGYYDIESDLNKENISRSKAIKILTYLNANGQYDHVIKKFNSSNSPVECKTFELNDWDK